MSKKSHTQLNKYKDKKEFQKSHWRYQCIIYDVEQKTKSSQVFLILQFATNQSGWLSY